MRGLPDGNSGSFHTLFMGVSKHEEASTSIFPKGTQNSQVYAMQLKAFAAQR